MLPSDNMLSLPMHFLLSFSLFLKTPLFFFLLLLYICLSLTVFLYHPSAAPTHTLSLVASVTSTTSFLRFTSFFPAPLHYSSLSFPQEEPQSYLGYVGFGELKSTLLTPCLSLLRTAQAI